MASNTFQEIEECPQEDSGKFSLIFSFFYDLVQCLLEALKKYLGLSVFFIILQRKSEEGCVCICIRE